MLRPPQVLGFALNIAVDAPFVAPASRRLFALELARPGTQMPSLPEPSCQSHQSTIGAQHAAPADPSPPMKSTRPAFSSSGGHRYYPALSRRPRLPRVTFNKKTFARPAEPCKLSSISRGVKSWPTQFLLERRLQRESRTTLMPRSIPSRGPFGACSPASSPARSAACGTFPGT